MSADYVVIATGSRPRTLPVPGAELAGTSDDFPELAELPESMIFIGGGYISLEFAFIAGIAGSNVTVLQRGERLLPQLPSSIVDPVIDNAELRLDFFFDIDLL